MKYFLFILLVFITGVNIAQINPSTKGFVRYQIETPNDTIEFFIYNPKKVAKKHLFIHVSGSYPAPLWIETDPCCVTLDPLNTDIIPEDYAYVVISKYSFPFSNKEDFKTPQKFWDKNTLDFRVERTNKVIEYIQNHIFKPEKIVLVGTSQGTDVVSKLATINKDITHIGFWSGGGLPQLMEFIMFVRKEAISGKITEREAAKKIDSLFKQFETMFNDPSPKKMWDENSYLSYVSYSEPPVKHLLKLDIPIYVAVGTKDDNVAVENSYIIPIEFIRNRKKNLTFKQLVNYDHNFIEILANGEEVDRTDEVTIDFIKWLNEN